MSNNKNKKPHFLDEYDDGEYLGNIWGWKFSFISVFLFVKFHFIFEFHIFHLTSLHFSPTQRAIPSVLALSLIMPEILVSDLRPGCPDLEARLTFSMLIFSKQSSSNLLLV